MQALTVFGGYGWHKQANPSDDFLNGFQTIGGWNVPATINHEAPRSNQEAFPTAWTNFTNFNVPRIAPYFWVGAKYAITPQLDVTGAYYYLQQTDFNTIGLHRRQQHLHRAERKQIQRLNRISSNKCAGTEDAFSALIDWRPVKRVDLYAGLMVSNVYGGLRERLPGDPEHRPDRRPARQVLTHGSYLPPAAALLPPRLGSVLCRRPPAGVASSAAGEER